MTEANARAMIQTWAEMDNVRVYEPDRKTRRKAEPEKPKKKSRKIPTLEQFAKRYGILLAVALAFTLYTIILSARVEHVTEKRVWAEARAEYEDQLAAYKAEQAYEAQKEHWLSGEASREAFINQEIKAGAQLISMEANDEIKGTKLGVAIARMKNQNYPNTIQEVAAQPNQFMFYSTENTYTQHDWDLAESMIRPLYEEGRLPNGLNENMVFFEWNGNTGTARDSYETTTSMQTWRYQ